MAVTLQPSDVQLVREALTGYQAEILKTAKWAETQPHVARTLVTMLTDTAGQLADIIERLRTK
jgi:hypothetical protein